MSQLDLFAPEPKGIVFPTSPYWGMKSEPGAVGLLWHGLHPHRTAWHWFDGKDRVWRALDPFDQYGINYIDTPPRVNEHGRLIR